MRASLSALCASVYLSVCLPFHRYIKRTAQILKDKYDSDIPDSVEKLCELPGVGESAFAPAHARPRP